jgi:hypothetical protein
MSCSVAFEATAHQGSLSLRSSIFTLIDEIEFGSKRVVGHLGGCNRQMGRDSVDECELFVCVGTERNEAAVGLRGRWGGCY